MWPIQTLTLLLCLTDEEQLFAQKAPQEPIMITIEVKHVGSETPYEQDPIWEPIG